MKTAIFLTVLIPALGVLGALRGFSYVRHKAYLDGCTGAFNYALDGFDLDAQDQLKLLALCEEIHEGSK